MAEIKAKVLEDEVKTPAQKEKEVQKDSQYDKESDMYKVDLSNPPKQEQDAVQEQKTEEVVLVAPPTLLPPSLEGWPVTTSYDLDEVLPTLDVCYLLRMQNERINEGLIPSVREYVADYGLNTKRAATLPKDALICHPGPTNRGIEIEAAVASDSRSVILDQVSNGVSIRMAVLFLLLGSGRNLVEVNDLEGEK